MKKAIVLMAVLCLVTSASANVNMWLSNSADGNGLVAGDDPFLAADYQFTLGGVSSMGAAVDVAPAADFTYLWLQFDNEAEGVKIQGISTDLVVTVPGGDPTNPADIIAGAVTNSVGHRYSYTPLPAIYTRWEGDADISVTGDPNGLFVGATSQGIQNHAALDMFRSEWNGASRTALIGAAAFAEGIRGDIYLGIGDLKYMDITPRPTVSLNGVEVLPGAGLDYQYGYAGNIVPEPASMLLLGLAGLLIRRR